MSFRYSESENYVWWTTNILGKGASGSVFQGTHKINGESVAVKTFNRFAQMRPKDIQIRELNVLKKINHKNIVKLLGIEKDIQNNENVVVMELCTGGSLSNILDDPENRYGLCDKEFLLVLDHLSAGVKYLCDNNLIHRDLKPANIMKFVSENGEIIYKLTDFGAAREIEKNEPYMSLYGTEEYLHPDIYETALIKNSKPKTFTANVDLWSMGVTLYHIAAGNLPFRPHRGRQNRETMHTMITKKPSDVISGTQILEKGSIEWSQELPKDCELSDGLKALITPLLAGLLEGKHEKMWSFDQFFKEVNVILNKCGFHVFVMNETKILKIFLEPECKFDAFQEQIFLHTNITPENQILLFKRDNFESKLKKFTKAKEFPKTEVDKPIFLYSRENNNIEIQLISPLELPKFPPYLSSVSLETDATSAQDTCGIAHKCKRRIEELILLENLMNESVANFVDVHKNALRKLLRKINHFDNFLLPTINLTDIISCLSKDSVKQIEKLNSLKTKFYDTSHRVRDFYQRCVRDDYLQENWECHLQNKNSPYNNRAHQLAKYLVELMCESHNCLLKNRTSKSLTKIEEQFHTLEKIKLTKNGKRIASILFEDVQPSIFKIAESLADWYKLAQIFYLQTTILTNDFQEYENYLHHINYVNINQVKNEMSLMENNKSKFNIIIQTWERESKETLNLMKENQYLLQQVAAFCNEERKHSI